MEKITVKIAKQKHKTLTDLAKMKDHEESHAYESNMHSDFIDCCANGLYEDAREVTEVAKIIKSTEDIDFERWFA